MPMIYTSFVRNSLIEHVRSVHGKYFANEAPDIAAGVVNLLFSEEFLLCTRPLSLSGQSHRSTGYPYVFGDASQRAAVEKTMFDRLTIHSTMVKSANFRLLTANYLLVIKERIFPDYGPDLNYHNMLLEAMKWVAEAPAGSAQTLPDVLEVARKNGISLAGIPASGAPAEPPRSAAGIDISGGAIGCDLDCASLGIRDVAGAAQLLEVVLPFNDGAKALASAQPATTIDLNDQSSVELKFARDGNGVACLDSGWGDPEHWGVWTVGDAAGITMNVKTKAHAVGIRIRGAMFVHEASPIARMTILCGNVRHEVEVTVKNHEVDLTLRVSLKDETSRSELRFELAQPRSPLELGISSDSRRLGLALNSITLTRLPE
jgi:hypothetical protein